MTTRRHSSDNERDGTCLRVWRRWQEVGKFLTGFGVVGSVGVPAVLLHAGMIATGAFFLQLLSVSVLFFTVLLWEYWMVQDEW